MIIDFSEISANNKLFIDYINNFESVENYYKINFREEEKFQPIFENICKRENPNKKKIVNILNNIYSSYNPSDKTKQNIELLNNTNTIAVFTGQQLGIMGGPLYTINKIFTAIKLAEQLQKKFPNYNFVPIFWMAGDDHDFEEISSLNIITKDNDLKKITFDDGNEIGFNRGAVGDIVFNDSISDIKKSIRENIRNTEFTQELFSMIDNVLVENISIRNSFFNLLYKIFDDTGLIIFDPQKIEVKKLLKPIFRKEILDYKKHTGDLLLNSADLEENYHAQVKIKPINLFMSDDTGRHLIEPIEDEYRLKGKRKRISEDEILELIETNPERFSANVLLRPICEDYLFPTGFYIGGPGEISYYAQVIPLYKHYNIQNPIIYPRASATIIESNIAKILIKYNLSTQDFFNSSKKLKDIVVSTLSEVDLDKKFSSAEITIAEVLDSLGNDLKSIDNNLGSVSENVKNKLLHQISVLKNKAQKSHETKFDSALRQINKSQNLIHPNNNLQERELTIINFVNRYGFDFFDWLYNELDINEFKHQILEM